MGSMETFQRWILQDYLYRTPLRNTRENGGTEISIYDEDKLLVEYKSVGNILTLPKYKKYLSKKVSYIDLDHYNDMTWLMITILRNQK